MHFTLVPVAAGILGVIACLGSMLLPRALGIARVDVVRATGEFVTKNHATAFVPGLIIHFVRGIIFAYVYYAFCAYLQAIPMNVLTGLFYGVILGTVMMLYVGIAVLEHHPDTRYQRRGPMTGLIQVVGNALFGLVVGWVCGAWAPLH